MIPIGSRTTTPQDQKQVRLRPLNMSRDQRVKEDLTCNNQSSLFLGSRSKVNITPEMPFPSGLVNISQENIPNLFKMAAPSMASNSHINTIAQAVCFIVITLHFLAGLTTLWCIFLLKAFIFLFEALGRPDIAGQIPFRLPTALSYSGVPPYHVTGLPVCPTCRDVFPVGFSAPVDYPRC